MTNDQLPARLNQAQKKPTESTLLQNVIWTEQIFTKHEGSTESNNNVFSYQLRCKDPANSFIISCFMVNNPWNSFVKNLLYVQTADVLDHFLKFL